MAVNDGTEEHYEENTLTQNKILKEENQKLDKQITLLKLACREAGDKIKKLEDRVESLTNPLTKMRKGGL